MAQVVYFSAARDGGVMARWEGKIAFPERGGVQPQAGETWEVEYAGTNPRGTVVFLRCIRQDVPENVLDRQIRLAGVVIGPHTVILRSEHNGDDKVFLFRGQLYVNARDNREQASIDVEWWPAIRDGMCREVWRADDDQTPRAGRRTSHGSSNFCYTAAYELAPAGVRAFEYALIYRSADAATKSAINAWLTEMGIMAPEGFIWTPMGYDRLEALRTKVEAMS